MSECICSRCKNLKGIIGEEGEVKEYNCEFGFPSDACENCEGSDCQETCPSYVCDEEEEELVTVQCGKCGRELKKALKDNSEGQVLCVDCYLKNNS